MDHLLSFCIPIGHITLAPSVSPHLYLLSFPFESLSINLSLKVEKDIGDLNENKKKVGMDSSKE